jgi:hypothetical protein
MKKIASVIFFAALCLSALAAYNPPAGGEDFNMLASPENLSGAKSVTGGALFDAGADSVLVNPALSANEQRVNLNVGYTFMCTTNASDPNKVAHTFQTGILIPFKLFIFSGYMNGIFCPFADMNIGDAIDFRAGISKEINDKLYVGLSANGGFAWMNGTDWSLGADVGALYRHGKLAFIDDFRIGAAVLNLGKTYNLPRIGIQGYTANSQFPGFITVKAGVAGTMFSNSFLKIGLSFDVTTPCFQNLIFDTNAQIAIKDMFIISLGEKFNLMESINGHSSFIPSVAVLFKFTFDVKNNQYLEDNGWSQSEMKVSAGYKNFYNTVHAISAAADIDLGMADNEPPSIKLWDNE